MPKPEPTQVERLRSIAETMSERCSDVQSQLAAGNYAAAAAACVQVQALAAYLRGGMDGRLFGEFLL
jgi:hypothetical protein